MWAHLDPPKPIEIIVLIRYCALEIRANKTCDAKKSKYCEFHSHVSVR